MKLAGGWAFKAQAKVPGESETLEGTVVFRNYRSPTEVVPKVRKVPFNAVLDNLPAGTKRVTPTERAAALEHRRQGFLKLHGE